MQYYACVATLGLLHCNTKFGIAKNSNVSLVFTEGLMCLSIEWKLYTCRNSNREQLRKIPLSYGAVHRHRTGVGSIPAGGPIVDEFFSTVPG